MKPCRDNGGMFTSKMYRNGLKSKHCGGKKVELGFFYSSTTLFSFPVNMREVRCMLYCFYCRTYPAMNVEKKVLRRHTCTLNVIKLM